MPEVKVRTVGDNDNNRLWISYEKDVVVRFNKCLPSGSGLQLNAREDDLKKTKQWMQQTGKPADFFCSFDYKSLSLTLLEGRITKRHLHVRQHRIGRYQKTT